MIAIKMCFLAGRFHATPWGHHVNEGVVEYPPSLWRFLRSLVATFHRTAPENVTEASLRRILDALSDAPEIYLPQASVAHTRHYDQANSSVKFFDTFVSLNPSDEIIWLWHDAELNDFDRENLAKLLRNLGTFGRSESWCEAELVETFSKENKTKSSPISSGEFKRGKETIRLLMPNEKGENLLETLKIETSKMRKEKQLEPNGSRWITYERDSKILTPSRIAPRKNPKYKPFTVARFSLHAKVLPPITEAIIFAGKVRSALSSVINRVENHHSPAFIGKEWNETLQKWDPMKGHRHAHFFITDEKGDGKMNFLTIYAPCGFIEADSKAFEVIRKVERHYKNLPAIQVVLNGQGNRMNFSKSPIFHESNIWRSVTPFSLPYFPNRGGGKPPRPKDTPEGQLLKELKNRNFPIPIRIERISGYMTGKRPEMNWLEFYDERKNMSGNGLYGFEIEFEDNIKGPVALGFGCHFGLGLFLPVSDK